MVTLPFTQISKMESKMPCPDMEILSLTLLAIMLNVFEAAHSPAVHVTLW